MQISGYIFPLLTFPYLTRVLQPEKFGIMVFASATIVYFQLFIDFGFLLSATRDCSLNRDNRLKLRQIISSVIQAKIILCVLGLIVILIIGYGVEAFYNIRAYLFLAYVPVCISIFSVDFLFLGLEIMKVITIRTLIIKIVYTILIFLFIRSPEQYLLIPLFTAIGTLISVMWIWLYIIKKLELKILIVPIKSSLNAIKESAIFFYSRIASSIYTSSSTVLLGLVYSNDLVAQYGAASTLIVSIKSLFSPIADSLYPYMVAKKNYKLVKIILFILMPLVTMGTIGLYLLSEPIIKILCGEGYEGAIPIFKALLPIVLLALPTYLIGFPVLGAMDRLKEANYSVIVAAIFHLVGIIILFFTNNFGFIEIALLTCVTEFVVFSYRGFTLVKFRLINLSMGK